MINQDRSPSSEDSVCSKGHSLEDAYHYQRSYVSRKTGETSYRTEVVCRTCSLRRATDHSRKVGHKARPAPVMPTDKLILAYAAGVFDGEGSVGIRLLAKKGEAEKKYHAIVVAITSTDRALTDWLQCNFGGKVNQNHKENATRNYKDAWKWILLSRHAAAFLEAIRPYLIIKSQQARVALELQDGMGQGRRTPITPEMFAKRQALYDEMKRLNRRGRAAADTERMVTA